MKTANDKETLIVRNVTSPRLYDVVEADFVKGAYNYLHKGLTFPQAQDIISALRKQEESNEVQEETTEEI